MEQQRLREVLVHADQWLADIWTDLRQRRPAEGDQGAIEKLRLLAAKADTLGTRMRGLHAAGRAVEEACVLAEHVLTLRRALVTELQDVLQPRHAAWEQAVVRMLEAADRADWVGDVGSGAGPGCAAAGRPAALHGRLRQAAAGRKRTAAVPGDVLRAPARGRLTSGLCGGTPHTTFG